MPTLYWVDTSAWVFALRPNAHKRIRQRIDQLLADGTAAVCGQVMLELLSGARTELEFARRRNRLLALQLLPTEEDDWLQAARLGFSMRRLGITVAHADILLSALSIRHNAILLHADRHFDRVAQHLPIPVESWADAVQS